MEAVKKGRDRQDIHERIRVHSMDAAKQVKVEGKRNDLVERLASDPAIGLSFEEIHSILDPKNFIGMAPRQVEDFISESVRPVLEKYGSADYQSELRV